MIEKLQQGFDMGQDVIIESTVFSPNDSHMVLAIYDKLDEKRRHELLSLPTAKIKKICSEI
jgi:hypothetical protein